MLRRIAGRGRAWIELSGDVVRRELPVGGSLRTHPWHIGMFDASVAVQMAEIQEVQVDDLGPRHPGSPFCPGLAPSGSSPCHCSPPLRTRLAPRPHASSLGPALEGGAGPVATTQTRTLRSGNMNLFARNSAPSRAGVLIACAAAAGLLLGACSNGSGSGSSAAAPAPAPARPGRAPARRSLRRPAVLRLGLATPAPARRPPLLPAPCRSRSPSATRGCTTSDTITLNGTVTNKVVAVKPVSGGTQVTMSNHDSIRQHHDRQHLHLPSRRLDQLSVQPAAERRDDHQGRHQPAVGRGHRLRPFDDLHRSGRDPPGHRIVPAGDRARDGEGRRHRHRDRPGRHLHRDGRVHDREVHGGRLPRHDRREELDGERGRTGAVRSRR